MADEPKKAPGEESKDTKATVEAKPEETKVEDTKPADMAKEAPEKEKAKMVPEAVFLEEKRERKELAKEIKELKKLIEEGATQKEVSDDVKELASEFGMDERALSKLISKIGEKSKAEVEKEVEAKLRPIQEKEREEKVQKTFDEHYSKLMEAMPEYKNVANKDVIKALSLDPKNVNKTFGKILEEAYGHLLVGRKTLEKTVPGGGKSDSPIDHNRAIKDPEYFRELMADPETKKKYNEGLISRLKL